MEQVTPIEASEKLGAVEAPETAEALAAAEAAEAERLSKLPTLEVLIARMMQTHRDIQAYERGEMTKEEFDSLGITFG